jgi:hypothetical protein
MNELTAKGIREHGSNSIVISPLMHFFISPLGVMIPLILVALVAPGRLVLLGVIPALTWVSIVPFFYFILGIS